MRCLSKPLWIPAIFLAVLGVGIFSDANSADSPSTPTPVKSSSAEAQKAPDLTFPSGLQLSMNAEGLLLLTKNGETIQVSYKQIQDLFNQLTTSGALEKEIAEKALASLNRLLNEQSDTLSSTDIMGLDKPLSLMKTHYKGPVLKSGEGKSSMPLTDINSFSLTNSQPPQDRDAALPSSDHIIATESDPASEDDAGEESDIPDGNNENRGLEVP
jgi:hypothetical protein